MKMVCWKCVLALIAIGAAIAYEISVSYVSGELTYQLTVFTILALAVFGGIPWLIRRKLDREGW